MAFSFTNLANRIGKAFTPTSTGTGFFRQPSPTQYRGPRAKRAQAPATPQLQSLPQSQPNQSFQAPRPAPFQGPLPAGTTPEQEQSFRRTGVTQPVVPQISQLPAAPPTGGVAPPPQQRVQYGDLQSNKGIISNKVTGEVYSDPTQLAAAMGIKADDIVWKNILPAGLPEQQAPTPPAPLAAQGTAPAGYNSFVLGKNGAVYKLDAEGNVERKISDEAELSNELGIRPHEIDWTQIRGEEEVFGGQGQEEGTVLGAEGGDVAPTPEELPPEIANSPEALEALRLATEAYQKSLQISPDELSTQADIDRLIESTRTAYLNAKGQPIALEFITGQLKATEERALALSEPLEAKLARIQAQRQSSLEASKFALERADVAVERELETQRSDRQFAEERRQFEEQMQFNEDQLAEQNAQAQRNFDFDREKFEEDKRRYGIEYAEDVRRADREYNLSRDKFDEDVRQFGLQYALQEMNVAIAQSKLNAEGAPDPQEAIKRVETAGQALALIQKLVNHDGFSAAIGLKGVTNIIPGSAAQGAKTLHDSLLALLTLENMGQMTGVLSDSDIKILQAASASLNRNLSEEDYMLNVNAVAEKLRAVVAADGIRSLPDDGGGGEEDPLGLFSEGGGGTPTASGMRTDRHNNPTAFTTDIAAQAGLTEGVDYTVGDPFPNNPNMFTANLIGNALDITRRVIDRIGFFTGSGAQRWSHTAIEAAKWAKMSTTDKNAVIAQMYQREGNEGTLSKYFA